MGKKSKCKKGAKAQIVAASNEVPITCNRSSDHVFSLVQKGLPKSIKGLLARSGNAGVVLYVALKGDNGDVHLGLYLMVIGAWTLAMKAFDFLIDKRTR